MWHYFIALPLVAKIIGLIGVAGLATLGWLKGKAIAATTRAAGKAAHDRFWNYVRKNVQAHDKLPVNSPFSERTYRGTFQGYSQYPYPPRDTFFTLVQDGVTSTVPIFKTNLLSRVQRGTLVEIDTRVSAGFRAEFVIRVREIETKKPGSK